MYTTNSGMIIPSKKLQLIHRVEMEISTNIWIMR